MISFSHEHQQELKRIGMQTGRNVLERLIVYSYAGIKMFFELVNTFIRQVLGR